MGTGPEAVLQIVMRSTSPSGGVVTVRCPGGGGANIPAEGHAERFGEALKDLELPAATGATNVSKTASIGGVLQVTVKGMFTVTQAR